MTDVDFLLGEIAGAPRPVKYFHPFQLCPRSEPTPADDLDGVEPVLDPDADEDEAFNPLTDAPSPEGRSPVRFPVYRVHLGFVDRSRTELPFTMRTHRDLEAAVQ
jgi:hypothetical protein